MALKYKFQNLLMAYRKAKADCYLDRGHLTALKFSTYESNLVSNLNALVEIINAQGPKISTSMVGGHAYILKTIRTKKNSKERQQAFFSNSDRSWEEQYIDEISFRIIGQHSIDFHVLSSLWIEKVGEQFEQALSNNSYGCRLKRKSQKNGFFVDAQVQDNNDVASLELGHVRSYITDYKNWQSRGLIAIEEALKSGHKVIAITADIEKFYHRIDPTFLLDETFLNYAGLTPSKEQIELTQILIEAIQIWSTVVLQDSLLPHDLKVNGHCGIPIGLSASKVIANLFLIFLDREIENELSPIYYGRYVDDIFLVINDNGHIKDENSLWTFVSKRIPSVRVITSFRTNTSVDSEATLQIPYGNRSTIKFQGSKGKIFLLEGSSGQTFIATIKEALDETSSEWNMLPESENDLETLAQEITKPSSDDSEDLIGLRISDGLSIKRLTFALRLKNFENMIAFTPKAVWSAGAIKFFTISSGLIVTPENLATYLTYYPRLISLAIRAQEPEIASKIWQRIEKSWNSIFDKVNSNQDKEILLKAKAYHVELLKEAVYSSLNLDRHIYEK